MSVSRESEVSAAVEALQALDTPALQVVAASTGLDERTLWRYRAGDSTPSRVSARAIAQALHLQAADA